MPKGSLKIYQKGVLLISIPLVFELFFGYILHSSQQYYESILEKENHAKLVIFHANELWLWCTEAMLSKMSAAIFKGRPHDRYKTAVPAMLHEYQLLQELSAGNQPQLDQLAAVKRCTDSIIEASNQFEPPVEEGSRMAGLVGSMKTFKKLNSYIKELGIEIKNFRTPEELQSESANQEAAQVKAQINMVLWAGLATSVVMAALLFYFFMSGIYKGISNLIENTKRLAQSQALLPESKSKDELGTLDQTFHQMAHQLERANNERIKAEQLKQDFFHMISHDMRTPLTSINLSLHTLSSALNKDELPAHALKSFDTAQRGAMQVINLINDLLDIDKLEEGKLILELDDVDIIELIRQAGETVAPLAQRGQLKLVLPTQSKCTIEADSERLFRVVVNLLSNAIKFSPPDSTITVTVLEATDTVTVEITDEGRGIPEHLQQSIFDRFTQVEASDATKKGGSGLGLAICKFFVESHKGMIGVKNAADRGSTVWFSLPREQESVS